MIHLAVLHDWLRGDKHACQEIEGGRLSKLRMALTWRDELNRVSRRALIWYLTPRRSLAS
jgi:hypothetical protein